MPDEKRPQRTQIMTLKEVAKYLGVHSMTASTLLAPAEPFSAEKNQALADEFRREGCLLVKDVLTPAQWDALTEQGKKAGK